MSIREPLTQISKDSPLTISDEISNIFDKNIIGDLHRFLYNRHVLNNCNIIFVYLFNIVQSVGILTTAIAAGYNIRELIWVGVGLNCVATLIHIFEKTNISILKKYMNDIELIKSGKYVDESDMDFDTSVRISNLSIETRNGVANHN